MKTLRIPWRIGALMVAAGWSWPLPVEAAGKAKPPRTAAQIVEETLQREALEGVENRADLLSAALEQARPYEPAYWQSGFIFDSKRKQWLRWDDTAPLAAKDDRLAAYREMRKKAEDTLEGQMVLARWCNKQKLDDQARAHWTRVLQLDPNHAEARQRLGFRRINGMWLDDHDIAEARTSLRKASAAVARWGPRLENLRGRLASSSASQRESARTELTAITDPNAVDAIDAVLCRKTSDLALLGIEALKNIVSPKTATVLAWHAVYSPWPEVRLNAARALRSQEKHVYVPLLLDAAQTPGDAATPLATGPGASRGRYNSGGYPEARTVYALDHRVSTYAWRTVEQIKEHPNWRDIPNMVFDPHSPNAIARKSMDVVKQGGKTTTSKKREYYTIRNDKVQQRVTETKVTVDRPTLTPIGTYPYPRNSQAAYPGKPDVGTSSSEETAPCIALAEATGEQVHRSPSQWRDWWYDTNEVCQPSGKPSKAPPSSKTSAPDDETIQSQPGDCLAAGTPVRAETGPTAIEEIAVGDRVFCCDPETGRLALTPVLRQTVRPEGRLLKISAGGEEFEASGGHVFWVSGKGWVKARDLREGMQLHTIRGTVPVQGIEAGTTQRSFSLVVADFHTFFAGKEMVLTHDNTIRPPTDRIVPGLASTAARPVGPVNSP